MSIPIYNKFTSNKKIIEKIEEKFSYEEVIKNPYVLIEFMPLEMIEKIILRENCFSKVKLRINRIKAYIYEYAKVHFAKGHTAFYKKELMSFIENSIMDEHNETPIEGIVNDLINKKIYLRKINDEILTTEYFYEVENYIYQIIQENNNLYKKDILDQKELEQYILKCEEIQGFKYDGKQRDILKNVNKRNNITFLNGYAGTGKTTTAKGILDLYSTITSKEKIICAAFSGVASARIKHATGYQSVTLHSLLKYDGEEFRANETNKLNYEVIMVDESGMNNSHLFAILLNAINFKTTELIIAGDSGQLNPIEEGNPFKDILNNNIAKNIVTLEKIYRQKETQSINLIAQDIRRGIIPNYLEKHEDFEFINSLGENILIEISKEIFKVKEQLINLIKNQKYLEYINLFQVISPIRKSELGVDALNLFIQNILNENNNYNKIDFEDKCIKVHDKVMHLQNRIMKTIDYDKYIELGNSDSNSAVFIIERKVMNGQTGIVIKISDDERDKLYVYYPLDNYVAVYTLLDVVRFKIIDLGYAITVHKSQGSQYNRLIIPIVSRFNIMLNSQLLYTAVTRAKDMLTIIGEKKAFEDGILKLNENTRITLLNNM